MSELERKVRLLREVQRMIEDAQAEAEALKDDIKRIMGDSEALCVGGYKVTYKPVTAVRTDVAAFRREMPELAARFAVKSVSRRLCIT